MLIASFTMELNATNIRGQIVGANPTTGQFNALPNILVQLYFYHPQSGWTLVPTPPNLTNINGFYFFWNINSGTYILKINNGITFTINVNNLPSNIFQDIAPIRLY